MPAHTLALTVCEAAAAITLTLGEPRADAVQWAETVPTVEETLSYVFDSPEGRTLYDGKNWSAWVPHMANQIRTDCGTSAPTVTELVDAAADEFGVDRTLMHRIVACESSYNPNARNPERTRFGHALGLGQHLEDLWPARAEAVGLPGADPFDPRANARVTAWLISTQGTRPYAASRHCWSR